MNFRIQRAMSDINLISNLKVTETHPRENLEKKKPKNNKLNLAQLKLLEILIGIEN